MSTIEYTFRKPLKIRAFRAIITLLRMWQAENELSDVLESGSDLACKIALMFYDHLNEYPDSFLEEHGFSREEIRQGVLDVAKCMGALYAAVAIMDEDP